MQDGDAGLAAEHVQQGRFLPADNAPCKMRDRNGCADHLRKAGNGIIRKRTIIAGAGNRQGHHGRVIAGEDRAGELADAGRNQEFLIGGIGGHGLLICHFMVSNDSADLARGQNPGARIDGEILLLILEKVAIDGALDGGIQNEGRITDGNELCSFRTTMRIDHLERPGQDIAVAQAFQEQFFEGVEGMIAHIFQSTRQVWQQCIAFRYLTLQAYSW